MFFNERETSFGVINASKKDTISKKMITTCTVTTGDLTSTKDTNGKRGNKLYRGLGGDVDGNEYW